MQIAGLQILVVGAGSGGAAAALLLARAGAHVRLIEKVAAPAALGAGIAIAPNGYAVLESLGLAPALAAARRVPQPRIVDGSRRTLLTPPGDTVIRMLRRATLQRVLLDAIAAEPMITPMFGSEVLRATAEGVVELRDADGGHDALSADLVVAADGIHSPLRGSLDFGARVRDTGIDYLRALVDAPACHEEAWTAAGIFGSFEVDGGTYLYASAGTPQTRAAVAAGDLHQLRAAWRHAYPAGAALLDAVPSWDQVLVNRVRRVDCARWAVGRVVLLGDAAHAMAPNLGQGANSAFVDAAVLLDELRRAATLDAALAAYETRRRPAVQRVADLSARLGRVSEQTQPAFRWLRDRLLLPLAQRLARDSSPLLSQEPPAALRAIGRG